MDHTVAKGVEDPEGGTPPFFSVSSIKFVVMSVVTLGLYCLFWFFMHWKAIRARENSNIWPVARGLFFSVLFCHPLFVEIKNYGAQFGYRPVLPVWVLSLAYILVNIGGLVLDEEVPTIFIFISLLLVPLVLLPMQVLATKINKHVAPAYNYNDRFTKTNIAGIIVGGIILVFAAYVYPDERDMAKAHKYIKAGNFDQALVMLDGLVERNPYLAEYMVLRSGVHLKRGEHGLALADIDAALEVEETSALLVMRGDLLINSYRYDEVIDTLTYALDIEPDQKSRAYIVRGMAYDALGQYENAIKDYDQWLEKTPNDQYVKDLKRVAADTLRYRREREAEKSTNFDAPK